MSAYQFELENAKALLAAERDPRKRRALMERIAYYQHQLDRIRRDEPRR